MAERRARRAQLLLGPAADGLGPLGTDRLGARTRGARWGVRVTGVHRRAVLPALSHSLSSATLIVRPQVTKAKDCSAHKEGWWQQHWAVAAAGLWYARCSAASRAPARQPRTRATRRATCGRRGAPLEAALDVRAVVVQQEVVVQQPRLHDARAHERRQRRARPQLLEGACSVGHARVRHQQACTSGPQVVVAAPF